MNGKINMSASTCDRLKFRVCGKRYVEIVRITLPLKTNNKYIHSPDMGHGLDLGYNNVGWVPGVNTKQTCSVNTRYQQYLVDYKY